MAYRLCTSLPSWLEGFDPPYPLHFGGIPEWLKGADCKSAGTAFDGSNPSPTTIYKNTDHCKRNGLFIFVNIKPVKALLHISRRQMLHTAQPCFIIPPAGVLRTITDINRHTYGQSASSSLVLNQTGRTSQNSQRPAQTCQDLLATAR